MVLVHHGILGQKWGVRRYQNEDGSLTPAGKKRYAEEMKRIEAKASLAKTPKDMLRVYDDAVRTSSKFGANTKEIKNNPTRKNAEKLYNSLVKNGLGKSEVSVSTIRTYSVDSIRGSKDGEYYYYEYNSEYGPMMEAVDPEDEESIKKATERLKMVMMAEAGDKNDQKALKRLQDTRLNKAKNFVDNLLFQASRKVSDVADAVGEVVSAAKDFVSKLLKIDSKSTTKRLTQRELDDEIVKKAYGMT